MVPTQLISIPFNRGVDTKSDKRLMATTSFPRLDNVIIGKDGTLRRRGGFREISGIVDGANAALPVTDVRGLFTYGEQLIAVRRDALTVRHEVSAGTEDDILLSVGTHTNTTVSRASITRGQTDVVLDYTATDTCECIVYRRGSFGVRAMLRDPRNQAILADFNIGASYDVASVVRVTSGFAVYATSFSNRDDAPVAQSLTATILDPVARTASTLVALTADAGGPSDDTPLLAAAEGELSNYIAYGEFSTGNLVVRRVSRATGALVTSQHYIYQGSGNNPAGTVRIRTAMHNGVEYVYVVWGNTTNEVRFAVFSATDGTSQLTDVAKGGSTFERPGLQFASGFAGPVRTIATAIDSSDASLIVIAEYSGTYGSQLVHGYITTTGFVVNATVEPAANVNFGIASEITETDANGRRYMMGVYRDAEYTTLYLLDVTSLTQIRVIGRALARAADEYAPAADWRRGFIPPQVILDGDTIRCIVNEEGTLRLSNGFTYTPSGLTALTWNLAPAPCIIPAKEVAVIAGSRPRVYDGHRVADGWTDSPAYPVDVAVTAGTGTSSPAGTRQVCFVYTWTDSRGNLYRSAPSVPQSVTTTATEGVTVHFTAPVAPSAYDPWLLVETYMTEASGQIFYRVESHVQDSPGGVANPNLGYSPVDTELRENEPLYTLSGEPDNDPPPPCKFGCMWQGSIVLGGLEDPLAVAISKPPSTALAPRFADSIRLSLDPTGGDITALAVLDDKLIIFKERAIFAVAGGTPDNFGISTMTSPSLIVTDVGCQDWRSVVVTPDGLMFQSAKGIYLLTRQLQATYVGAGVELYNSYDVVGAVLVPDEDAVHFYTSGAQCLIYNWGFRDEAGRGQWSVCQLPSTPIGAVEYQGSVYYTDGSRAFRYTPDDARDLIDGVESVPSTVIETAWLKLAALQGFQRVKRAYLLGTYQGPSDVTLAVFHDYSEFVANTFELEVPTGATGGPVEVLHHIAAQKCAAIRFRLTCAPASVTSRCGIDWTGLTLELGIKKGGAKLSAAERG